MNTLPANWYTYSVADGVTEDLPGIYIWSIEDRGEYVGKFSRIRRPTKEYARSVARILADKLLIPGEAAHQNEMMSPTVTG